MWPYHPELLATPVPRYTSFPTAAEFGDHVGPADFEAALASTTGAVSLYVHIPFCKTICWYCGCNTGRANRSQRLASYLEALHREIALVGRLLPKSAQVRRIAFGGGSPNAITPTDFVRLCLSLTQSFSLEDPTLSVELDPRTLEPSWAQALAGTGVRHASLGVQTFNVRLQEAIGRIQPIETIERCTALLRQAGITSLNYALMYGLPGQTGDDLAATLEQARDCGADRIALFGYAHLPDMIPRQRRIDATGLPDQRLRFDQAARGHERLTEAGYVPVGFDHFALPGDPLAEAAAKGMVNRNFQGFTEDSAPVLLGFGASAISRFPDLIVQNEKRAGPYREAIGAGRLAAVRGVKLDRDERERGDIIRDLLWRGEARLDDDRARAARPAMQDLESRGVVAWKGDTLVIPDEARPYSRIVAARFDRLRGAIAHGDTVTAA